MYASSTMLNAFARCSGLPHAGITPTRTSRAAAAMAAAGAAEGSVLVLVEVGFVAPVDGVERVMDGQMQHRHRPADDDVVLAAGGGGVEPSNVPVENLIGGGLVRKQNQQPENAYCQFGETSWDDAGRRQRCKR